MLCDPRLASQPAHTSLEILCPDCRLFVTDIPYGDTSSNERWHTIELEQTALPYILSVVTDQDQPFKLICRMKSQGKSEPNGIVSYLSIFRGNLSRSAANQLTGYTPSP